MTDQELIQRRFFDILKQKMGNPRDWATQLAELLHYDRTTIYKKSTGQSALAVSEMVLLAHYFEVDMAGLLQKI